MAVRKADSFPWYSPWSWVCHELASSRMFISSGIMPESSQSWRSVQPFTMLEAFRQAKFTVNAVTFGGAANVLNRKDDTMPKLDPEPRRAQKRSWFSVSEALTAVPLASTTVAPSIQSTARPWVCELKPKPPCSTCPPTPTLW